METIAVRWYNCNCPWATKLCDEEHTSYAQVPISVLEQYKV